MILAPVGVARNIKSVVADKYMVWKKISQKKIYKNKWMEVTEDVVRVESGKKLIYGVIHKKPFALIIPWDGEYLTLVRQYRYPVRSLSWEFPAGHYDFSSLKETTKEELEEEAGLKAKKIKEIGRLFLAPGHHTQVCHVFLGTDLTKGKQSLSECETGMIVKKVTPKKFCQMVKDGLIKDSTTIAAFQIININKKLYLGDSNKKCG